MIAIVGSGILGLAVAEYLSRTQRVVLISNEHPLAGSHAAAANLMTKAQLFGRDVHFQRMLSAREIYRTWLQALLIESGKSADSLDTFFCEGVGLEFFKSDAQCQKQFDRVSQPEVDLKARNLGLQPFERFNESTLRFFNEAWVDAATCLNLLRTLLAKRKVEVICEDVLAHSKTIESLKARYNVRNVVFCTGAWTTEVLAHFGLALQGSKKITIGSTLIKDVAFHQIVKECRSLTSPAVPDNVQISMCELRSPEKRRKVVISGAGAQSIFSSSSERVDSLSQFNQAALLAANNRLDEIASMYLKNTFPTLHVKTGLRVKYGHTELVVKRLSESAVICCGAHKTGFLFAPVVGELVAELL